MGITHFFPLPRSMMQTESSDQIGSNRQSRPKKHGREEQHADGAHLFIDKDEYIYQ